MLSSRLAHRSIFQWIQDVVARGAAVYASSLERSKPSLSVPVTVTSDGVRLKLAYDPVSSAISTKVGDVFLALRAESRSRLSQKWTVDEWMD